MTESLQRAFDVASLLPAEEQEAIATWILAELESDGKWAVLFEKSQDKLAALANKALEEHKRGDTQDLD